MNTPFEQPGFLIFIPFGIVAIWKLVRQKSAIGFSTSILFQGMKSVIPFLTLERLFLSVFVAASLLILARPIELVKHTVPVLTQARDIVLVLDISGSMSGTRIDTAKQVIAAFVAKRPGDRIGIFTFDTNAYLEWPLSIDHDPLLYRLDHIEADGGTTISTGLIAALQHLATYGKNPGAIIMFSDGGSNISEQDKETIAQGLGNTKLYWTWIGDLTDPDAKRFSDYFQSVGGKVYIAELKDLDTIVSEISQLETSPVAEEEQVTTLYTFGILPYLAFVGLLIGGLLALVKEV